MENISEQPSARTVLNRDLSKPEAIPQKAVQRANELMMEGTLCRYGEEDAASGEVSLLEREYADYMGLPYALGLNSCGCAMFVALKAVGVQPGDKVLMNAFTLAPVPGSIAHAGAEAIMVEITSELTISLEDLEAKAKATGAKYLLLSHMRGHIADMEAVEALCQRLDLTMIEDCAHTMGARWNQRLTGTFGKIGCFSTQAYKHMNSGEGGILVTADPDVAARAVLYSGSYMLYGQHDAIPPMEVFEKYKFEIPNCSMRMSNLVGALLRPQLQTLDERSRRWNNNYRIIEKLLRDIPQVEVLERANNEQFVGSSIQFMICNLTTDEIVRVTKIATRHGVHIKWFGRHEPEGFTSRHLFWKFVGEEASLPETDAVLNGLCDIRVPADLTATECETIAVVIREAIEDVTGGKRV